MEHIKTHNPDVILLSETMLNSRHSINFKNYNIIRNDRIISNRGTAIVIRNTFKYEIVKITPQPAMEYTAISLKSGNNTLYLYSIYQTGNSLIDCSDLESFLNHANNSSFTIIGGDFNSKHEQWSNYNSNQNGVILRNWYNNFHDSLDIKLIHSTEPSHYGYDSHSFIDFFIVSEKLPSAYKQ